VSITLNTKVYNGNGVIAGVSSYTERTAGVAAGFSPVTATVSVGDGTAKSRIRWKLHLPVVATEASACACPGQAIRSSDGDINVRLDPGSTTAERTDFALRLKDLVASPEFQASIINLQQPAGT
jgi:hypothetical protein